MAQSFVKSTEGLDEKRNIKENGKREFIPGVADKKFPLFSEKIRPAAEKQRKRLDKPLAGRYNKKAVSDTQLSWLEHLLDVQGVRGSSPLVSTISPQAIARGDFLLPVAAIPCVLQSKSRRKSASPRAADKLRLTLCRAGWYNHPVI